MYKLPLLQKLNLLQKIILISSILIAICFWSNLALDINPFGTKWAYPFFILYISIILTDKKKYWKSYKWEFSTIVTWTIFTVFLSFIPAYIDWGQSIFTSIAASIKWTWVLLLYFVLRKWNISTTVIMKYIIIISTIWVIIEIGQQFTFPTYWFAGRPDEGYGLAQRMGLYRFYIWGVDFVMLAYAYCLGEFASQKKTISKKLLALSLFFLVGLLCYCSRKHIYISLAAIGYAGLMLKNKYRLHVWTLFVIIFIILFYNFYNEFAEMNQTAVESQGEGEDFIRFLSLKYFLFDFSDSPLYVLLGSGIPGDSKLWEITNFLKENFGFYREDIGIFGYYSLFGIIGTSAILFYIWKFIKNWKYIDLWLKIFFLMKVLLIVFDFWAMWNVGMMAYAIFLYMLDLNIQKNKKQRTEI